MIFENLNSLFSRSSSSGKQASRSSHSSLCHQFSSQSTFLKAIVFQIADGIASLLQNFHRNKQCQASFISILSEQHLKQTSSFLKQAKKQLGKARQQLYRFLSSLTLKNIELPEEDHRLNFTEIEGFKLKFHPQYIVQTKDGLLTGNLSTSFYSLDSKSNAFRLIPSELRVSSAVALKNGSVVCSCRNSKSFYALSTQSFQVRQLLVNKSSDQFHLFQDWCGGISQTHLGEILYTDFDGHSAYIVKQGRLISITGGRGQGSDVYQLNFPVGIVQLGEDIFISDSGNNRIIQVRNKQPNVFLQQIDNLPLNSPWGLATHFNELFIADQHNDRIIRVTVEEGQIKRKCVLVLRLHSELRGVTGIAVNGKGDMVVAGGESMTVVRLKADQHKQNQQASSK